MEGTGGEAGIYLKRLEVETIIALQLTGGNAGAANIMMCMNPGDMKVDCRAIEKRTGLNPLVKQEREKLYAYICRQLDERGLSIEQLIEGAVADRSGRGG